MADPSSPMGSFWEDYQRFMQRTFETTHKFLQDLNPVGGAGVDSVTFNTNAGNIRRHEPSFRLEEDRVVISFAVQEVITAANTQIFLEGYQLTINGPLQIKIPLPVAVKKFGGRARFQGGVLEIYLPLDKYTTKQAIPLEIGPSKVF